MRPITQRQISNFWKKVGDPDDNGCWPWLACTDKHGYGAYGANAERAHRFALRYLRGMDVKGLHVHHNCENPGCVNPDHLEAMLPSSHQRKHGLLGCKHGHPWTKENTRWKPRKPSTVYGVGLTRECRTCRRLRNGGNEIARIPYWTRERVIASLQEAAAELGRTPCVYEFHPSMARQHKKFDAIERHKKRGWPVYSNVTRLCGSWAAAIDAAGLEKRPVGAKI